MENENKKSLDLGYATLDLERKERTGASEVIYGQSKNSAQIAGILQGFLGHGEQNVLITRIDPEKAEEVQKLLKEANADSCKALEYVKFRYFPDARIAVMGDNAPVSGLGPIAVVTGGTSDLPVAEEAARTAKFLGNEVIRVYDVGVAGIHRLFERLDDIRSAKVVIAIAGMEGALASVVGGLVSAPVIAVPTSVGYGASFGGISALLSMLNSCASGVSVVNIDNGFGAGYQASMINHMK